MAAALEATHHKAPTAGLERLGDSGFGKRRLRGKRRWIVGTSAVPLPPPSRPVLAPVVEHFRAQTFAKDRHPLRSSPGRRGGRWLRIADCPGKQIAVEAGRKEKAVSANRDRGLLCAACRNHAARRISAVPPIILDRAAPCLKISRIAQKSPTRIPEAHFLMIDREAAIRIARRRAAELGWPFEEPVSVTEVRRWYSGSITCYMIIAPCRTGSHSSFTIDAKSGEILGKYRTGNGHGSCRQVTLKIIRSTIGRINAFDSGVPPIPLNETGILCGRWWNNCLLPSAQMSFFQRCTSP